MRAQHIQTTVHSNHIKEKGHNMAKLTTYRENSMTITLTFTGIDLTGATVYFTVKSAADTDATDTSALIKKDITSHTDAINGATEIVLTPTDTDIAVGKYKYDIKLKKADGQQTTTQVGEFIVKEAITNRG